MCKNIKNAHAMLPGPLETRAAIVYARLAGVSYIPQREYVSD